MITATTFLRRSVRGSAGSGWPPVRTPAPWFFAVGVGVLLPILLA